MPRISARGEISAILTSAAAQITTMDVQQFDQVLANPMWHKRPSPINPRQLIFEFEVSMEASILYTVDLDLKQVAANSVPRELQNFRPAVADWSVAWEKWFRPWCGDSKVIEYMQLLWDNKIDWLCNTGQLSIAANYNETGDAEYEMRILLTPEGKVKLATMRTWDYFTTPVDDSEPTIFKISIADLCNIVRKRVE